MRNILYRMNGAMARFMYGRYGVDELSKHLLAISLIFFIASNFKMLGVLYYVAAALMIYSLFRCYSKNIDRRNNERHIYLKIKDRIRYALKIRKSMWKERKTHKYIRCERCGKYFRVPKGVGSIIATCPGCRERMKINC